MESNMEQRGMQAGEKRIGREETGELDRLFLDLPPREAYPLILAKAWEGSGRALFLLALYLDGGYGTFFFGSGQARVYASAASQVGDPVAPAFLRTGKTCPMCGRIRPGVCPAEKRFGPWQQKETSWPSTIGESCTPTGKERTLPMKTLWPGSSNPLPRVLRPPSWPWVPFSGWWMGGKMAAGGRRGWDGIKKLQQKAMQKLSSAWPRNTVAMLPCPGPGQDLVRKSPPARAIPCCL